MPCAHSELASTWRIKEKAWDVASCAREVSETFTCIVVVSLVERACRNLTASVFFKLHKYLRAQIGL